jgi:hypothetical protein
MFCSYKNLRPDIKRPRVLAVQGTETGATRLFYAGHLPGQETAGRW